MAADRQHHRSKKNRYTIILVPDEDAGKAKNFKFTQWQFVTVLTLFAAIAVVLFILIITYTPVGQIFPLSNPGLEIKYSRGLISLNQKMMSLMEQLVELRAYNIKLRRALGENVALSDSGVVKVSPKTADTEKNKMGKEGQSISKFSQLMNLDQNVASIRSVRLETEARTAISFPAILPTQGYLTRGFEPQHNHLGLDIAGKTGTVIVAAADGNVVFSGWTYNDGYVMIISHSNGFLSFYKHNQSLLKYAGSFVRRGDPIATLGNSGTTSSGPHLHFEIWKDGIPVDPSAYIINLYL